ncbi:DUF1768-domain-containing protein [Patellaria atrata CBS 101060]|uniref:DUF1768-domain-containing protein n=1 Tax=Patellaria atrata CBS 101060 TaxID=1346257 RepID=A0A9P4VQL6_9PEZI|nr:DUF1768-domain-containing protein [Patellaria atrata CBS 101060]
MENLVDALLETIRSTTERFERLKNLITPTHIFFYGYELQVPEGTLQQWYPSSFLEIHPESFPYAPLADFGGIIRYQTAEHYMMYHKALFFRDLHAARAILAAHTPAEANSIGRKIQGFDRNLWVRERDKIVGRGNWLKFTQVEECRRALLATGNKILVEASPDDRTWGIGFWAEDAEGREEEWGENRLGKALMKVRDRLRREGWELQQGVNDIGGI